MVQRYLMAEALERMGDPASAARWYRSLLDDYTDTRSIAFRGAALLGEARALAAQGDAAAGRDRLRRAARLWVAADPSLRPDSTSAGVPRPPGESQGTPR